MPRKRRAITYEDCVKGLQGLEPEEQLSLIELISAKLKQDVRKREKKHSILELEGLGAEIWKGIDPQGYIKKREGVLGLVDKLHGSRVCIDTAPFIYFIEEHPKYVSIVRPVFAEIDAG